eukprot:snap_masked-scaffold_89-processed-gene-0.16-mRNA-1 protein AED:1.00 eAED:1.00 QI:0/-1/0/0/-1/1/1/0/179
MFCCCLPGFSSETSPRTQDNQTYYEKKKKLQQERISLLERKANGSEQKPSEPYFMQTSLPSRRNVSQTNLEEKKNTSFLNDLTPRKVTSKGVRPIRETQRFTTNRFSQWGLTMLRKRKTKPSTKYIKRIKRTDELDIQKSIFRPSAKYLKQASMVMMAEEQAKNVPANTIRRGDIDDEI